MGKANASINRDFWLPQKGGQVLLVASPKSTSYARRCFAAACDYIVSHMLHQEVWGLRLTWLVGKGAADLIPANEALERDEDLRILDCSTTLGLLSVNAWWQRPMC